MQSPALKPQVWHPGLARRADNFQEVCALAKAWRWSPGQSVARVTAAILKGTPALTASQRQTLMLYAEHLNQNRLEKDNACVWPSAALIADYLGCSDRAARANRKALEAAGYMVRDYNRANRPAGVEAFDLAPLLARLPELEAAEEAIRGNAVARRAAYLEPTVHLQELSGHPEAGIRLEQSDKNFSSTVTKADALNARYTPSAQRAAPVASVDDQKSNHQTSPPPNAKRGSPEGAGFDLQPHSGPAVRAEMVRDEVFAALEACPRLARLLPRHLIQNPLDAQPADEAAIGEAAQALLPQPQRNNGETARWGWRKHGPRVIAMLAIALEDAGVRDPCAYFGKLASSDRSSTLDLRLNLRRIIQVRAAAATAVEMATRLKQAPLLAAPGVDDPIWRAIDANLRQIVPTGAYASWFGRLGFGGIQDDTLVLTTPGQTCADRLKTQFLNHIERAAEAAGHPVARVLISVRPSGNRR
ncbi:MAG: helix-turn-helix domain-containing protein [Caulobacteraceae bacterium]